MTTYPILETARLILRAPVAADLDGWAELMGDADSSRHLGGVQTRAGAWRGLATMSGSWMLHGFSMFSVIEKSSGRWVGRIGPWRPEDWPGAEVGWGLVKSAWHKGYGAEAATATIDWAFDALDWTEVIHTIDPQNAASKALAQRIGSRYLRQGSLPEPFSTELEIWGQSREEWRARRPG